MLWHSPSRRASPTARFFQRPPNSEHLPQIDRDCLAYVPDVSSNMQERTDDELSKITWFMVWQVFTS
eukprot:1210010-Amphidinium_carterae.1